MHLWLYQIQLLEFYGNKLNEQKTANYLKRGSNLGKDKFGRQISPLQRRVFRSIRGNTKYFDQKKFLEIQELLSPLSLEVNTRIEQYNPKRDIE